MGKGQEDAIGKGRMQWEREECNGKGDDAMEKGKMQWESEDEIVKGRM